MRSSPIVIGTVITAMCISISWAEEKTLTDTKPRMIARSSTEVREGIRPSKKLQKNENAPRKSRGLPNYKPPKRGAPGGRVGGGTRGDHEANLTVEVLAPGKVRGLTSHDLPELYWYISKPTKVPIEFTLIDEAAIEPLVETQLPQPAKSGIQRVRLSDFGIHLTEDKMYRWSIALVGDKDRRSKDIVAGARIQHALESEIPTKKLAGVDPFHAAFINAESGLWYDALASISQAIKSDPEQSHYHDVRAALLDQVGLGVIANIDRKRMAGF